MKRKTKLIVALTLAPAIVVGGCNAIVWRTGHAHVRAQEQVDPADAILVLGAGVHPDGTPSPVLADRLETARALYVDRRAPRVLVSGDHVSRGYDEPRAMRRWLVAHGVPRAAIFLDHAGVDTYTSMWRARHVFEVRRAIVVTQAFHLPRALYIGDRLGLDVEGVEADLRPYRGAAWFSLREVASRTKAWLDVAIGRTPRFGGPKIPIDGDARATEG